MMKKSKKQIPPRFAGGYVIGVDGGGTKTVAALSTLEGKILKLGKSGPSSPRNIGTKTAVKNIARAIVKVLKETKNKEISSVFIGLPALEEEYKFRKKEIKKELLKQKEISSISKIEKKLIIGSDQIAAFRSGTDEKHGVLLIAGTGCVAFGWRGNKKTKVGGWGWLADEGSGFWMGQKGFQAILKAMDGRGPKTLITRAAFRKFRVKNREDLLRKVYSRNPTEVIPSLAILINEAGKKKDRVAKEILKEAGKELALAGKIATKNLDFKDKKFPFVLVGGMFNSEIILQKVREEIKKIAPGVMFIRSKKEPVTGAVKLALENLNKK